MNIRWKFFLNLTILGLSIVGIVSGLLWAFFVEMTPESAGATVFGVLGLLIWLQTRKDQEEQAKDSLRESNKLYKASSSNAIWAVNQTHAKIDQSETSLSRKIEEETERKLEYQRQQDNAVQQQKKDLTTLNKLWQYITPRVIERIDAEFDYLHDLLINETLHTYQDQRRLPQNVFIDESLEKSFAEFDKVVAMFVKDLSDKTEHTFHPFFQRFNYMTRFKLANNFYTDGAMAFENMPDEALNPGQLEAKRLFAEYNLLVDSFLELVKAQKILVQNIKKFGPADFQFPDDLRVFELIQEKQEFFKNFRNQITHEDE